MKKYLLAGFILFIFCICTHAQKTKFYKIPSQENKVFHQIFEGQKDNYAAYITEPKDSNFVWTNPEFEVSELVTLYEYKVFLEAIKQDSGKQLFLAHLPDSNICPTYPYAKYINSSKYHNSPIVGITWEQAQNYCYWKSLQEQKDGKLEYIYRLPTYPEWLSAYNYLKSQKTPHDFNQYFSDWTYSTKYENVLSSIPSTVKGPPFIPKPSDPSAWKRFVAIGNSYQRKLGELAQFFEFSHLKNNGFADISFRLIKTPIDKITSTDSMLLEHWKTYGMYTTPSTFKRYHSKKRISPLTIDPINRKKDSSLVRHLYETDISQVRYETQNGRLHGGFEARVINPPYNYMIKGQFNNNQRVGE
ncbi:MAG: SUMF1/EgtB/PvdO family nonheme iron enzyme [Aureispira sp.]|nr:SUMF1/EgtB/PvdO family nonheme iron enzyme [Aureispira sp.]